MNVFGGYANFRVQCRYVYAIMDSQIPKGDSNMKKFDDFLETLNPSDLSEIAAKEASTQTDAFAGTSQAATAVTIEIIRQYHEWLTQQLS